SLNKAMLAHPHMDIFEFVNRYGPDYFGPAAAPMHPSANLEAQSGIIIYVESDGRHLSAISREGKLLWARNPFVENNMCPYRSAHPFIVWIGPPGADFGFTRVGQPTPDAQANAQILKEL